MAVCFGSPCSVYILVFLKSGPNNFVTQLLPFLPFSTDIALVVLVLFFEAYLFTSENVKKSASIIIISEQKKKTIVECISNKIIIFIEIFTSSDPFSFFCYNTSIVLVSCGNWISYSASAYTYIYTYYMYTTLVYLQIHINYVLLSYVMLLI